MKVIAFGVCAIFAVLLLLPSLEAAQSGLREHEVREECGPFCEPTCAQKSFDTCISQCVSGEFCESGYIRQYINGAEKGPCVLESQCDQ